MWGGMLRPLRLRKQAEPTCLHRQAGLQQQAWALRLAWGSRGGKVDSAAQNQPGLGRRSTLRDYHKGMSNGLAHANGACHRSSPTASSACVPCPRDAGPHSACPSPQLVKSCSWRGRLYAAPPYTLDFENPKPPETLHSCSTAQQAQHTSALAC